MRDMICRFLLVVFLTLPLQTIPAVPAHADVLTDLADLIDDVGSPSWLPASGQDIRDSREFIICLSNGDNDIEILKCIEDFRDTPLGSKIGDEIPSWVYDLITVYIALQERDYTTLLIYLGKAAACAILQVISGGSMDVCGLIEELVETAKALMDAATAVYEFFKDVGSAAWDGVKAVGCALGIGGCDDDSSPPHQVAYSWIFAPKVRPQGLAAIEAVDASEFPNLRAVLEANARAKPPVTGEPALDQWMKSVGYSFPDSAVNIASATFQKTVEAQWKADIADNVLPKLSQARADYGSASRIASLAGPALSASSPDGQKFRFLVTDQCVEDLNVGMKFAHVDRWVAANPQVASIQFHLKSNRGWCGSDFWSPEVKSEFAKHLRVHVRDTLCPMGGQGFVCQSTARYDECRKLLKAVDVEGECRVDVAKVGHEVAQKIVDELKARGSTTNYAIRDAVASMPVNLVCVRPTQQHACNDIYASKYGHLSPRVVDCDLKMTTAYKTIMSATAVEAQRLTGHYNEPFAVDDRDPLFVHAPSQGILSEVQNDPQQQFDFDYYMLAVPRSVDGLDRPGMGVDVDLTKPLPMEGKDRIEEKVRGFHAGGPIDPMDENPMGQITAPVDETGNIGVQGLQVAPGQLQAKPGTSVTAPANRLGSGLKAPAGAATPMSGSLPPGTPPPTGAAKPQMRTTTQTPQAMRTMQTSASALPDISPEGQVVIGGMGVPWGHTASANAARATSTANGICFFPIRYTVRNTGAKPSGAFHSAWTSSQGPVPREKAWPSLAPGTMSAQTETIGLKPGRNELILTLDSRRECAESDEADNRVRITIVLTGECGTPAVRQKAPAPNTLKPQQTLPQRLQVPSGTLRRTQ